MTESTSRPASWDYSPRFVGLLEEWLTKHTRILDVLVELRASRASDEAVEAILSVKVVRVLVLSWQLWDELVASRGDDPDEVLLDRLPRQLIEHACLALWGSPWRRPTLTVVEP